MDHRIKEDSQENGTIEIIEKSVKRRSRERLRSQVTKAMTTNVEFSIKSSKMIIWSVDPLSIYHRAAVKRVD